MKEYIRRQYRIAEIDYKLARSETEQQKALDEMHRLTLLATTKVGFGFADSLKEKSNAAH